jgi:hypothetical protein
MERAHCPASARRRAVPAPARPANIPKRPLERDARGAKLGLTLAPQRDLLAYQFGPSPASAGSSRRRGLRRCQWLPTRRRVPRRSEATGRYPAPAAPMNPTKGFELLDAGNDAKRGVPVGRAADTHFGSENIDYILVKRRDFDMVIRNGARTGTTTRRRPRLSATRRHLRQRRHGRAQKTSKPVSQGRPGLRHRQTGDNDVSFKTFTVGWRFLHGP